MRGKQLSEVLKQLEQLNVMGLHDLVQMKKSLEIIDELQNPNDRKRLKNEIYARQVHYYASLIETINLGAMAFLLLQGSYDELPFFFLKILMIECIQESLQNKLRQNNFNFESISQTIMEAPKQIFSLKFPDIARSAGCSTYGFLQSNLSFFYRKVIAPDEARPNHLAELNH
ncbi:Uncharacterised protein [Legionella wadsworthii]|uniref:Uncharacterized protein n=1 Tax=Legionella wadsworthii TaxID=28088 RepID=A0A378LR46_9GAMM|nr:hypothetical protein [Legionella wadsworthii]STY28289.1 Uncharacterised protein [Legionella wadsworthii]